MRTTRRLFTCTGLLIALTLLSGFGYTSYAQSVVNSRDRGALVPKIAAPQSRFIDQNTAEPGRGPAGTIYYVSPSGNDANSGLSPAAPWATFDRAWQALYPGDTLILMDGIYRQKLQPNRRNGQPGNPITIRAQHDGRAVIDGEFVRPPIKLGECFPPAAPPTQGKLRWATIL